MKKAFIIMSFAALTVSGAGAASMPEIDTTNPLLAEWNTPYQTPPFDQIRIEHYAPAFDTAIACARAEIEAIVENPEKPTFENTIVPMERHGALLKRVMGLFFNLLEADTSDEMQRIAMDVQGQITEFTNDVMLNPELFARVRAVYKKSNRGLSQEDKQLLDNAYRSFTRGGAALSERDKELYRKYTAEEADLTLRFGQNALSATNAFEHNITDQALVAELPESLRDAMAEAAKERGQQGWTLTLDAPIYMPFLIFSSNRELKEMLWRANTSRGLGGEFDNTENVKRITTLRLKIAKLLGYKCYADYVLEERMAENAKTVNTFINELLDATRSYADRERDTLMTYARSIGFTGDQLMSWDWGYYAEKYKNEKYALNSEMVKPYLQLENVQKGIFMLANKLYGLNFTAVNDVQIYHPDVTAYKVTDADGEFLSMLYLDFFPRASKRQGAWMTLFRGSWQEPDGSEVRPLVSLVMNFTKPTATKPSLLTFQEMTTFLHEFGHALHGMLGKGKYESLNGANVYRDFVELPSQIMENWGTEKEFLDLWAVHYQTGEPIPAEIVDRIVASQNYLAAYANVRQLSFAMNDMAWHSLKEPFDGDVCAFEAQAMAPTQVLPFVENTAMAPAFNHIFSGGYAAGYYGYKWAEVLDADAFSLFKQKGIFNREVAQSFRDNILSQGGQDHPMTLYMKFRGHKPENKALIDRMGLDK